MSKFKEGDKVVCVDAHFEGGFSKLNVGEIYTVNVCSARNDRDFISLEEHAWGHFFSSRFELAEEADTKEEETMEKENQRFEVGDRVFVVDGVVVSSSSKLQEGDIGTIKSIKRKDKFVGKDLISLHETPGVVYSEDYFELIERNDEDNAVDEEEPPDVESEEEEEDEDTMDHPSYYCQGGIEVIDIIEGWDLGFHDGNVVKYLLRSPYKDNEIKDLEKAVRYLQRHLEIRREELEQNE